MRAAADRSAGGSKAPPAAAASPSAPRLLHHRILEALVLACLLLLALLPVSAVAQAATPEVFGIRFGINDGITRIVLDIDRPSRFEAKALDGPPRLVVDLDDVRWRVREHPQGRPRGLARGLSYGRLDAGRARLVIDVGRPFRIVRQERLAPSGATPHHRIIVDLAPLPDPVPNTTTTAAAAPRFALPLPRPTTAVGGDDATALIAVTAAEPSLKTALPLPGGAPPTLRRTDDSLRTDDGNGSPPVLASVEPGSGPPTAGRGSAGPDSNGPAGSGAIDRAGDAADDGSGGTELSVAATPVARPPLPPLRRRVIALDAGHGGADPGAIGINGVYEKIVTLEMARQLRALLEETGRYEVVMTRDSDVFVSLRERMETARRAQASLFISIHADSLGNPEFGGASVYTLSDQASDAEAARLAAKENRADVIAGTDLSAHDEIVAGILIDLAQRVTNNSSIEFADVLAGELRDITRLVRNTRRFAGFVVLKSPDVPSVLLELGYLSNPTDAANLARPEYREKLARAALRAIDRHFATSGAAL